MNDWDFGAHNDSPGRLIHIPNAAFNASQDFDGFNQIRLTQNDWNREPFVGFEDRGPAWSPDGSKIAFASWAMNYAQIYVMDADGSNPIALTINSTSGDLAPAWSPDGSRIAFSRFGAPVGGPPPCEIYVMNADGSNQVRLTDNPGRMNESPAWSPDGSKIAFDSNRGNNGFEIYVMDADGSNQMAVGGASALSGRQTEPRSFLRLAGSS